MFWHLYSIRLRASVRDRQMLFWTLLFPLILATFFSMAFANLNENDTFSTIPIAVVTNDAYQADPALRQVLAATATGETALFRIEHTDTADADDLLRQESIAGYLVPGDPLTVVVSGSGIRQTILKVFADDYLQTRAAMEHILATDSQLLEPLLAAAGQRLDLITDKPIGSAKADQVLTYYYALIAMACLYGGFWGLKEVIAIQPNLSSQAARLSVAPVPKLRIFAGSLLAALTIQIVSMLLLLGFLRLVLGIPFGSRTGMILLATLTGSLLGVSVGGFIGAVSRLSESIKNASLIGFSMICSFLSGLMIVDIKYMTVKAFPPISYLNPANLISDAFYALYYYDSPQRSLINMGLQLILSALLFGVIVLVVRRQRYASL